MQFHALITIVVILVMLGFMIFEIFSPELTALSALCVLVFTRVLTPEQAVAGFSNKGMLTVAALFVVSAAVQNTGALDGILQKVMGSGGIRRPLGRMMIFTSSISAFLNNTPVVTMLTPAVNQWATRFRKPASKFLIPLSYAAIIGGTCTLIGTSTNLIVSGLMVEEGFQPIGMFELTKIGIPLVIVSYIYILFIGVFILPEKKGILENFTGKNLREYLTEMHVPEDSPLIGKNIEEAGLRQLAGSFLAEIQRGGDIIAPVAPNEILRAGDQLVFTGVSCTSMELLRIRGLTFNPEISYKMENKQRGNLKLLEVVISPHSPLIGKNARDANFRRRYDAVILAVHRNGEHIRMKIGDVQLQIGDTLLLEASRGFMRVWSSEPDFLLISELPGPKKKSDSLVPRALLILTVFIILAAVKINYILFLSIAAALAMIMSKCIEIRYAYRAIEWKIIIMIVASIGIGKALMVSGAADQIAAILVGISGRMGPVGVLAILYICTSITTELISNNAAAVLMFPIAFASAGVLHLDPRPLFIAVAIAASASFSTPIGYQTNMIVYGAGHYQFKDFLKVGIPLNILVGVLSVILIPMFWQITL